MLKSIADIVDINNTVVLNALLCLRNNLFELF